MKGGRCRRDYLAALANGERSSAEVADSVGVRWSNVMRGLNVLEDVGLVERVQRPPDFRRVWWVLTSSGRAALQARQGG